MTNIWARSMSIIAINGRSRPREQQFPRREREPYLHNFHAVSAHIFTQFPRRERNHIHLYNLIQTDPRHRGGFPPVPRKILGSLLRESSSPLLLIPWKVSFDGFPVRAAFFVDDKIVLVNSASSCASSLALAAAWSLSDPPRFCQS